MASTDLTPIQASAADRGGPHDPDKGAQLIRRPAELVELAELVYRGVFGAGLLVASLATLYAVVLGTLHPAGHKTIGIAVCSLLLVGQLLATHQHTRLYPLLRRRPWLVLLPAVAIGAGAWATGAHNQQLFYVLTILLGVLGAAVPLRVIAAASLVAAAGMAAPHIADGSWTIGAALAAGLLPALFWLILDQLVRFMLRLHRTSETPPHRRPKRVRAWVEGQPPPHSHREASTGRTYPESRQGGDEGKSLRARRSDLTPRQLEVLLLCAEGLNHEQIGECLEIGAVQVGRHLHHARDRASLSTNAELVAWGVARGLIPPGGAAP